MAKIKSATTENVEAEKLYLIVINKETGERITSYRIRVHANTMDELKTMATSEYGDCMLIEDDGTIQCAMCDGTKIYKEGKVQDRPPYVPTIEEEQEAAIKALNAKYEPLISDKEAEITNAVIVYQDEEWAQELRDELNEIKANYTKERELIING